jgi:hypothetical protein
VSMGDDVVTLEEFAAVDWKAPLAGTRKADAGDIADLFATAAKGADAAGDARRGRVFWLLFHVCNIMLDPSDRATPFRPRLVLTEGRSAEPADYRGAQSEVFAALLPEVANPGLRARLSDIVWTNDRKARDAAASAADAYCEVVEGLLAETFDEALPGFGRSTFEQVGLAHRALQIGRATLKGNALPDRAVDAAKAVYARARDCREHVVFMQIAGVLAAYGLMDDANIARDAETLADGDFAPGHAFAVQGVWDFAASCYATAKDADGERRCRVRSVDMTLARARSAASAMVSAHWLRVAIEALRRTRDILATNGHEPTIIKSDMTQEDQTLAPLLSNFRGERRGYSAPKSCSRSTFSLTESPALGSATTSPTARCPPAAASRRRSSMRAG